MKLSKTVPGSAAAVVGISFLKLKKRLKQLRNKSKTIIRLRCRHKKAVFDDTYFLVTPRGNNYHDFLLLPMMIKSLSRESILIERKMFATEQFRIYIDKTDKNENGRVTSLESTHSA